MKLIYIYGPPGVGKYTVGRELAKLTGYKLFHNQLSIAMVEPVFAFGSRPFNEIVLRFRREVIEEAAKAGISLIFTSAYAKGYNDNIMKDIIKRVERHNGSVHFVQLSCDRKVLLKRVMRSERKRFSKIRSPRLLARLLSRYDHTSPIPFRDSLFIDNTRMGPREAAGEIAAHYKLKVSR